MKALKNDHNQYLNFQNKQSFTIKHFLIFLEIVNPARQPRTQAQVTKNMHTTVLLYRSVAKLGERAGVLGEDAGNEAPGRICNKHGGHEDAKEEIAVLFAHRALHLGKILCPNDHCVVIRTFPRKRYYLSF
jgi:hypothetical protein